MAKVKVKVQEGCQGFFGSKIRNEGDTFYIKSVKEFSERWMDLEDGISIIKGKFTKSDSKSESKSDSLPVIT